jgi:co-chaperonin GroES (HSP10)|tara:strand:+ start:5463 stop:5831 length:369 start_codon:yes stop_codon:yes gene_type:complete
MINNDTWATDNNIPTPEKVPQPVGYRILIRPRGIIEKTKGGIILTDLSKDSQAYLNSVGQIIAMGEECYSDRKKPWCKVGDWVIFGRYAGARISVQKVKMLLLNDDEIIATLESPEIITQQL